MKFEFSHLPITTLIGANWRTFNEVVRGRKIDKPYRAKYRLTKILCWVLSRLEVIESWRYRKIVEPKPLQRDPLFILGHWRSGTTYLHSVLSCDKQFGYTTTYQTVLPNAMLFGQPLFKAIMRCVMPSRRPVDGLELDPDLPQEEEFALSGMSRCSYYNFWFFPRSMMEYCERYLLMNEITAEELSLFERAFVRLIKISLYNTGGQRYLSKNPPHTGRIKELLRMFPDAKFVYLVRNPYDVFESTRRFFVETIAPLKLQDRTEEELTADFVEVYRRLYEKYQRDKLLIPSENLVEMRFEDFEANPIESTQNIYQSLSLDGFESARAAMEQYVAERRGHKRGRYNYPKESLERVETQWGRVLRDWNYHPK